MSARGFGLRVALFYAALFGGIGIHLPFVPVWLAERGFGASEIAALLATQILTRVGFGPVVAFIADWIGDRRAPLRVLSAAALVLTVVWGLTEGFWPLFGIGLLLAIFWSPIMPLIDAFALGGSQRLGLSYGRIRLWGSVSFIAASVLSGLVVRLTSPEIVVWLLAGGQGVLLAAALALPRDRLRRRHPARTGDRISIGDAVALMRAPLFLLMMGASSLAQATHAIYYGFGTLHWRTLGYGEDLIGGLWALGVVAEIGLFYISARVLASLGPARLIACGAAAAVLRWGLTALDPPLWLLVMAQIAHAATFGAVFLGTIHFIGDAVPERLRTTAQGLYAAVAAGIIMGGAMAASGPLYEALGAHAYLVMGALGAVAAVLAMMLVALWDGSELTLRRASAGRD